MGSDAKWSAYAPTHRLVSRGGLFDENIWPAYYEDNDYAIRVQLSGLRVSMLKGAKVGHGNHADGSTGYQSGTIIAQGMSAAARKHKPMMDRGIGAAQRYLELKWGTHGVPTNFAGPWNNDRLPLSAWTLLPKRRKYIQTGQGGLDESSDRAILSKLTQDKTGEPISHPGSVHTLFAADPTCCAVEKQDCKCHGTVIFGALFSPTSEDYYPKVNTLDQMLKGPHKTRSLSGRVRCDVTDLGEPLFGQPKYCRCMQDDKSVCANEDKVCKCSGTVYYGPMTSKDGTLVTLDNLKNGQEPSKTKHATNGSLTCSNEEFGGFIEGDPAEGRVKVCRCDVDGK